MTPGAPDLDAYRAGVERHLAAPSGDPGDLFGADAVRGLVAAAAADPAVRPLARFAAEGHLRGASARETATAERLIREPLVGDPRDGVSPAAVDGLLADEPDAERRRELHDARLRAIATHVRTPLADAADRRDGAARALGATSATALVAGAAGADTPAAAAGAALLLDATDDLAARGLARIAGDALGRDARRLSAADLPRVVSAPQLADALPPAGAVAARTSDLLGMQRGAPPGSEAVRLGAVAHALRATGTALAREGASARLPVEARALADPALAAAAGRLLEGLVAEPAWLARVAGVDDPEGVARTAGVVRLLAARAAAARAASLGASDPDGVGRALGVGWPAELTLADPLAGLAPIDDLRARALAAALRVHLRETFGERWFAEPAAGTFLRELWLEGGRLDPDALARELGAPGADAALVAHEAAATAA